PVKVMNNSGQMTFTSITNGITHAADNGAHVISMSIGAESGADEGDNPACDTALYYAQNAGCVIFAATANSNAAAIAYPSNHTVVISVGAASPTGQRKSPTSSDGQNWWGSNYGVNIQDDPKAVDIMAATILPATTTNGSYSTNFNGTSCATPYAAGVAGLILSKDPGLTPDQVRDAIVNSATDMTIDGGAGWDRYTGYGMINADGALALIAPGMPNCVITSPQNNSAHNLGSVISVNVTSSDTDGTIAHVAFYVDDPGVALHIDYDAPYTWNWNTSGFASGPHTIIAMSTDNDGNVREASVSVMLLLPAHEGFESGLFDIYPWSNLSGSPWTIQDSEYYSGTRAAKAGTITHLQDTTLSLYLNVTEPGSVSFFHKVSSEANYDYLRFFIDGVQQGQWSGNVDWTMQSYPVAVGPRTFTWTYVKDQGVDSGSDTAWLDHIIFPPHNAPPFAPSDLDATVMSPTRVLLAWSDNSDDETEFYIEKLSGGFWTLVDWALADVTSAVISGLNPQTNYSFRVRAYNANGNSAYSNVASVMTLGPDSPDNVFASADGNQVNLAWSAPLAGCDGYQVWRFALVNGEPVNGVLLTATGITSTSFADPDWHLQEVGDYLWQVVAFGTSGNSAPSLSNSLHKVQNGVIMGSVTNLSGVPIPDAVISCGTLAVSANAYGVYVMSVLPGIYILNASHADYEAVSQENVEVASDQQFIADFQLPLFTVATPTFAPEPGIYTGAVDVVLACATDGAEIRYTLDGSDPDASSALYTEPIHLTADTTIRVRACLLNCAPSEIAEGVYQIAVSADDPLAPAVPGIQSVYPNPFSASLNIRLYLKEGLQPFTLAVYNLRGELVHRQTESRKGGLTLTWDGRDAKGRRLATGIYLLRLEGNGLAQTRKIVLK
ncbi:MAG: S8 family serine peptidase, partial [Candidatus Syntrophosphaera sp.]|nr:S8 family serine peptidase [Candidatus Syntrophosphaera sp.]